MVLSYTLKRLGQGLIVLWLVYTVTFIAIELLPSDPITAYLTTITQGAPISPETIEQIKSYYGYDSSAIVRYFSQLGGLLRGDLGYSLQDAAPVSQRIGEVIVPTIRLALGATLIATILSASIVTAASLSPSGRVTAFVEALPPFLNSLPTFWLGILALQIFSFQLRILPLYPDGSFLSEFIPALVLGIAVTAPISQVALKSVRDAASQPFVAVARAKGASPSRIFLTHTLKHSGASVITMLGLVIGFLLTGAIVVEKVFGRTGIGSVLERAVTQQDYSLIQGFVLVVALAYVLINFVVDLLYPLLDPRVRLVRERA